MPERDPLEDLRQLWRELDAPDPDATAERGDAASDAALAWMRAAWNVLEVPPAVPPRRLGRPGWRLLGKPAAPLLVAAAVLLAALGTWWWGGPELQRASPREESLASVPQSAPEGTRAAARDTAAITADAGAAALEIASIEPDRMELRSGPVRLFLVTGPSAEPVEPTFPAEEPER